MSETCLALFTSSKYYCAPCSGQLKLAPYNQEQLVSGIFLIFFLGFFLFFALYTEVPCSPEITAHEIVTNKSDNLEHCWLVYQKGQSVYGNCVLAGKTLFHKPRDGHHGVRLPVPGCPQLVPQPGQAHQICQCQGQMKSCSCCVFFLAVYFLHPDCVCVCQFFQSLVLNVNVYK